MAKLGSDIITEIKIDDDYPSAEAADASCAAIGCQQQMNGVILEVTYSGGASALVHKTAIHSDLSQDSLSHPVASHQLSYYSRYKSDNIASPGSPQLKLSIFQYFVECGGIRLKLVLEANLTTRWLRDHREPAGLRLRESGRVRSDVHHVSWPNTSGNLRSSPSFLITLPGISCVRTRAFLPFTTSLSQNPPASTTDPNEAARNLTQWLTACADYLAPLKDPPSKPRSKKASWFTDELKDTKKTCRTLEKAWLRDQTTDNMTALKHATRKHHQLIRTTKKKSLKKRLDINAHDSKELFSIVKEFSNPSTGNNDITPSQDLCDSLASLEKTESEMHFPSLRQHRKSR
ncbi:uncharacterized protein LOC144762937 [Lissotriton helveticus]